MKPYFGLRSYTDGGVHYGGQIGSEGTPGEWVAALVECTREWARVLKPSGSMFVNLGDKYAGSQPGAWSRDTQPFDHQLGDRSHRLTAQNQRTAENVDFGGARPKSLLGLPWRYAIAVTDQLGLILRRDIIWAKPNGLPESVTDRCRSSHEYVFHLTRQPRYYAAVDEIREEHAAKTLTHRGGGTAYGNGANHYTSDQSGAHRNGWGSGDAKVRRPDPLGKLPGSVWNIPSQPLTVPPGLGVDHFAAFPSELPRRCVLGWSPGGVCVACGEGRRPVTVTRFEPMRTPQANNRRRMTVDDDGLRGEANHYSGPVKVPGQNLSAITGYACACGCRHGWPGETCGSAHPYIADPTVIPLPPTRPAIVLDPFGGTGTTALVASVYGRTGISIDHSADYNRIAAWRTQDPAERCRVIGAPKPPPVLDGQDALFDFTADGAAT